MTSAPEYGTEDTLDDVAARLCDETPGVMSLRYRDARIPGMLADVIRLRCPGARSALIPYQSGAWEGADGSVSQVIAAACREAAGRPSTIVLLFPDFKGSEARDLAQVSAFWKRLNSQREVLGGLHARVLVGISPDDEPFAHCHAMDLLSWCIPKFNVQAMQGPVAGDPEISQNLPERSLEHDETSDADRLRQMAMAPIWKELVSSKTPLTAQRVEDVGLPLLDEVLSEGAIGEAEAILAAMEKGAWPRRLQAKILTGRGRLHQLKGHLDEALNSFQQALGLLMELPHANPSDAGAARAICVTLEALADAIVMRGQPGDATKALGYYERSLELSEGLLAANPHSAEAARDLSVSLNRLADFLTRRGQAEDATKALENYERSLKLSEDLLATHPHSAQAARDVSVTLNQLANFLTRRGQADDATKALEYYERSLKLSEDLLAANPHSAGAARDVSVTLALLADFLTRRGQAGDATKALGFFERSLKLRKDLLAANPHSAQAARDVSVSLDQLGKFLTRRGQAGDATKALGFFERSLKLSEDLLAANPHSAQAARDVSVSLDQLGKFLTRRGQADDATKALGYFERSLKLSEDLLAANPHSAEAARDVSVSLNGLADFLTRRGQADDATKALEYYERSLKLNEDLLAANPHSAEASHDVLVSLERMAKVTSAQSGFDAAQRAHDFQERALQIALRLREANPTSAFYGQTAAISFFLANQRSQAAGQEELARQHLENCHSVLHELISGGGQLNPHLMHLYQRRNTAVEDSQPQTA